MMIPLFCAFWRVLQFQADGLFSITVSVRFTGISVETGGPLFLVGYNVDLPEYGAVLPVGESVLIGYLIRRLLYRL
jgi:hypothetical protein